MCLILGYRIYEPIMKQFLLQCTLFSLMACSEPFEVDRHDLIAPRILGVRQQNAELHVQVWNGEGVWHQTPPTVEWFNNSDEVLGTGVHFNLIGQVPTGVRYIDPLGVKHVAQFDTEETIVELALNRYDIGTVNDLALDARLDNQGTLMEGASSVPAMRLVVEPSNNVDNARIRWMTSFGQGTFLERSALETDFFQENILMDRDELELRESQEFDYTAIFALMVNGSGHNQWAWFDLWYAEVNTLLVQGRHLRQQEPVSDSVTGQMAFQVSVVDEEWGIELGASTMDLDGVDSLDCAPESGVFQLEWLELGVCTLSDIDQQWVVLEVN